MKHLNILRLILSIMATLVCVCIFYNNLYYKAVCVSIHNKKSLGANLCVYYTENEKEAFSEAKKVTFKIKKNQDSSQIFIPASKLYKFRLDINAKDEFLLESITMHGRETTHLNFNDFIPRNFEVFCIGKNTLRLKSKHKDPFIVYAKPLNIQAETIIIRWWKLFILVAVPFYIVYVLFDILNNRSVTGNITTQKLLNVEFLRILFTLGVLMTHYFHPFKIWNSGVQGVEFFFLLSGYLLALTIKSGKSIIAYAKQRYIRFVPLIVLGGILSGGEWKSFQGVWLLQATGLFPNIPNGPAWYISVLFWCSLFYIALLKTLSRQTLLVTLASIAFVSALMITHINGNIYETFGGIFTRGMLRGISCMACGIILASYCRRTDNGGICIRKRLVCSGLELLCVFYVFVGMFSSKVHINYWAIMPISHSILLCLFILKRGYISDILEHRMFGWLSKYCLAIYLTHNFFRELLVDYISIYSDFSNQHPGVSIAITIILSFVVGVLAHHLVEKPCTRYLTRFFSWMKEGRSRNESKL